MVANIVLNASTTAASGANLEISSAAEVVRPTSRPLGPNGFTQLMSVFPFNGPVANSASFTCSQGTLHPFGIGCFSLYATKNITTAEGGVITTDDDALADKLRVLRNQGMRARYQYEVAGHNYRMTDLHAAVGIPQLAKLDQLTAARQANAKRLSEGLAGTPGLDVPQVLPGREHVWHQYTVLVGPHAFLSRDELAAALTERGIGNGIYYPKIVFDYDCYAGHDLIPGARVEDFPVARAVSQQALSLPVHPHLTESDLDTIIETVREVLGA